MRTILFTFLFIICKLSYGQYTEAKVYYYNGEQQNAYLLRPLFPSGNKLITKEKGNIWLKDVEKISIDSAEYFYKEIEEREVSSFVPLERIVHGKVSLYRLPTEIENRTFFVEKGDNVRKLQVLRREVDQNTVSRRDQYKSILKAVLHDCPDIGQSQIDKVKLSYSSLKDIVVSYNQACGWSDYIESVSPCVKNRIGVRLLAGYSFSSIPINYHRYGIGYGYPEILPELFAEVNGNKPFFGLGIVFKGKKLSLSNDIILESFRAKNTANSTRLRTREQYYQTIWDVDYQFVYQFLDIRDHLAVRMHFFDREKANMFFGPGLSFNYILSNQSYYSAEGIVDHEREGAHEYTSRNDIASDRNLRISPTVVAGIELEELSLHYQLNFLGGYIENKERGFSEHRLQVSYTLFD